MPTSTMPVTNDESVLWSEVRNSGRCPEDGECQIEKDETWIMDESMKVFTLTIYGSLIWDTTKDDLILNSTYVMVKEGGSFELGTEAGFYIFDMDYFFF